MSQLDLRLAIDEFYEEIDSKLKKSSFILNKDIEKINEQIAELRKKCDHKFENGLCVWCDLPEELKE